MGKTWEPLQLPWQVPVPVAEQLHGCWEQHAADQRYVDCRSRVTLSGRGTDFYPDFSPVGYRLVFRTSGGRYAPDTQGIGLEGIFVANVRTRRERQIQPRTGGLFPTWSPNGRKIAFSGLPRGGGPLDTIHVVNPTVFLGSRARACTRPCLVPQAE